MGVRLLGDRVELRGHGHYDDGRTIRYLLRCFEASRGILEDTPEEIASTQVKALREWVESCDHECEKILNVRKFDEGSEHLVYLRESDSRVFKVTWPGVFGDVYYLVNNDRQKARFSV